MVFMLQWHIHVREATKILWTFQLCPFAAGAHLHRMSGSSDEKGRLLKSP
jgi:hypothetical protein